MDLNELSEMLLCYPARIKEVEEKLFAAKEECQREIDEITLSVSTDPAFTNELTRKAEISRRKLSNLALQTTLQLVAEAEREVRFLCNNIECIRTYIDAQKLITARG